MVKFYNDGVTSFLSDRKLVSTIGSVLRNKVAHKFTSLLGRIAVTCCSVDQRPYKVFGVDHVRGYSNAVVVQLIGTAGVIDADVGGFANWTTSRK